MSWHRFFLIIILVLSCSAISMLLMSWNQAVPLPIVSHAQPIAISKPKPIPKDFFQWPIKGNIDLAGNFGELRANHFHTGLDIRTHEGEEGIEVFAAADGYISRINISSKGYGKAIYIKHPNGYITVYGHLKAFVPAIENYTLSQHYKLKSFEIDTELDSLILPVKKGELIAYSGNTGGSAGPHLHFEIRDAQTGNAINPLLFGLKLKDTVAPKINSIIIYGLENSHQLSTGTYRSLNFNSIKNTISTSPINLLPGVYALGASWADYLKTGGFRIGIPYAKLMVNGEIAFEQKIESIPFSNSRLINCHLDYPILEENDQKIIKLFVDDGNTLNFYPNQINKGKIMIEDNKAYQIKLLVMDFDGLKDSIEFTMVGNKSGNVTKIPERLLIKENINGVSSLFYPNHKNALELNYSNTLLKVEVPQGVLYDTLLFRLSPSDKAINGNRVWNIMNTSIPINDTFSLAIKPQKAYKNPEKYVMMRLLKNGSKKPENTKWDGVYIVSKAKFFGQFYYDIDETAPEISKLQITDRNFSGHISDNLSGIKEIITQVDGQWILTDYEPKLNYISGHIPDFIKPGIHEFKIEIKDYCGNIKIYTQTIAL